MKGNRFGEQEMMESEKNREELIEDKERIQKEIVNQAVDVNNMMMV